MDILGMITILIGMAIMMRSSFITTAHFNQKKEKILFNYIKKKEKNII
jgi:hypothetical protein